MGAKIPVSRTTDSNDLQDPENHQERQREIIAEIDEARKELEKTPKKRRFGFFTRSKKLAAKKEWETYDDGPKMIQRSQSASELDGNDKNGLFDIDAIRAELASEQIQVREIESTLPPMKLDLSPAKSATGHISNESLTSLRMTKSLDGHSNARLTDVQGPMSPALSHSGSMSPGRLHMDPTGSSDAALSPRVDVAGGVRLSNVSPPPPKEDAPATRPALQSSFSMPAGLGGLEHNAWVEDNPGFGKEHDITLTFE